MMVFPNGAVGCFLRYRNSDCRGTKVEDKGTIYLTRPLAQVNFADNTTKPVQETHKAVVTFHRFPTSFDPFSGMVTMSESDMSFIFKDFQKKRL